MRDKVLIEGVSKPEVSLFTHRFENDIAIDTLLIGDSIADGIVADGMKTIAVPGGKIEDLVKVIADEEMSQFNYFIIFAGGNNLHARSHVPSDIAEEPMAVYAKLQLLLSKVRELPNFRELAVLTLLPRYEVGSPEAKQQWLVDGKLPCQNIHRYNDILFETSLNLINSRSYCRRYFDYDNDGIHLSVRGRQNLACAIKKGRIDYFQFNASKEKLNKSVIIQK